MSNISIPIPELQGNENFQSWSAVVKLNLLGREEWAYVSPEKASSRKPSRASTERSSDFEARLSAWEIAQAKAALFISANCSPSIQRKLSSFETGREMWDYLHKTYQEVGIAHQMNAYFRWEGLRFDGTSVEDFCGKYQDYLREIDNCKDVHVNKLVRICSLIRRLEPFYPVWAAIERRSVESSRTLPEVEDVVQSVLNAESRRTRKIARSMGQDSSLYANDSDATSCGGLTQMMARKHKLDENESEDKALPFRTNKMPKATDVDAKLLEKTGMNKVQKAEMEKERAPKIPGNKDERPPPHPTIERGHAFPSERIPESVINRLSVENRSLFIALIPSAYRRDRDSLHRGIREFVTSYHLAGLKDLQPSGYGFFVATFSSTICRDNAMDELRRKTYRGPRGEIVPLVIRYLSRSSG